MNFERHNIAALTMKIPCENAETLDFMLMSDIHFDSSLYGSVN